jgi:hypothetical protein
MSEKYVVVATFTMPMEAQVACGRLGAEGIPAHVTGGSTASTFAGLGAVGGRVELYVPESACERALDILAECMPGEQWRVMFNKDEHSASAPTADWPSDERVKAGSEEFETERDSRIWVCSLCGDAVPVKETVCPSCGTVREAVRPADSEFLHENRTARRASDTDIQKEAMAPKGFSLKPNPDVPEVTESNRGVVLASRALTAAIVALIAIAFGGLGGWCVMFVIILPTFVVTGVCLIQLLLYSGELNSKATRRLYIALFLDVIVVGLVLSILWSLFR